MSSDDESDTTVDFDTEFESGVEAPAVAVKGSGVVIEDEAYDPYPDEEEKGMRAGSARRRDIERSDMGLSSGAPASSINRREAQLSAMRAWAAPPAEAETAVPELKEREEKAVEVPAVAGTDEDKRNKAKSEAYKKERNAKIELERAQRRAIRDMVMPPAQLIREGRVQFREVPDRGYEGSVDMQNYLSELLLMIRQARADNDADTFQSVQVAAGQAGVTFRPVTDFSLSPEKGTDGNWRDAGKRVELAITRKVEELHRALSRFDQAYGTVPYTLDFKAALFERSRLEAREAFMPGPPNVIGLAAITEKVSDVSIEGWLWVHDVLAVSPDNQQTLTLEKGARGVYGYKRSISVAQYVAVKDKAGAMGQLVASGAASAPIRALASLPTPYTFAALMAVVLRS